MNRLTAPPLMTSSATKTPSAGPLITALCALLLSSTAQAQTAADPIAGRALFENTIATTGNNTFTGDCTSCHSSIQERRQKIGGSPFAEISLTAAGNRLGVAIGSAAGMSQFQALTQKQIEDLAAYIADTPETSTDQLNFTAAAVNMPTAGQSVDLRHARATGETLQVVSVSITGSAATRFRRSSDSCQMQTLSPGGSCRVTVDYTAPDTAGAIVPMTFTLRQGASSTTFTRTMFLDGATASTSPPGGGGGGGGGGTADDGGGALGWPWLVGLVLACAALVVARRHDTLRRQSIRAPRRNTAAG